ncbi:MAG: hypothetical protein K2K42_04345, partial [Eubacterium sp.]|nr:hypothetical protein [Eubacterium sp.]
HNSDNYIIIDNINDVSQIRNDIIYIEKNFNDIKSYQMKEVQDFAQLYVKFENINALYYIGILGLSNNGELVFYNAHYEQPLYYLLYDNNSANPFSIVLK